jgi:SAM-dependent methyltransferase
MSDERIVAAVETYYTGKLCEHGATPAGVDWNGEASQALRFTQLLAAVRPQEQPVRVLDYGCGYGALVDALGAHAPAFEYQGYDLSEAMVAEARARHAGRPGVRFTTEAGELEPCDYALASGVFNVRLETPVPEWEAYVWETLDQMARLSERGFAFNALTAHADPGYTRAHLYYADPAAVLDRCLRRYARDVALRHDYELYEFTVIVRLDGRPPV